MVTIGVIGVCTPLLFTGLNIETSYLFTYAPISLIYAHQIFSDSDQLADLFYQPKSLYNHALSIVIVTFGVGITVVVCLQSF